MLGGPWSASGCEAASRRYDLAYFPVRTSSCMSGNTMNEGREEPPPKDPTARLAWVLLLAGGAAFVAVMAHGFWR